MTISTEGKSPFHSESQKLREENIFSALVEALPPLADLQINDFGCGEGGIGIMFAHAGARVNFIDGRKENLEVAKANAPGQTYHLVDLHGAIPSLPQADITLCLGLLYHTDQPSAMLSKISVNAPLIAVETVCLDHDGELCVTIQEDDRVDFSLDSGASRMSPKYLEKVLSDLGYGVEDISSRVQSNPPSNGYAGHLYQWEYQRTGGWRRDECSLRKVYVGRK